MCIYIANSETGISLQVIHDNIARD